MPSSWGYICFCLLIFTDFCISSAFSGASYKDSCSSIVPKSNVTSHTLNVSLPYFETSYFTGGDKLIANNLSTQNIAYSYTVYDGYGGKSLRFPVAPYLYETETEGIYKVRAWLYISAPYIYYSYGLKNYRYGTSSYHKIRVESWLIGYWSKNEGKLCMVGSATLDRGEGDTIKHDVVLKLSYAGEKPNVRASIVSGTFESAISSADDSKYFDPISIFHFPAFSNYEYSLVTKEEVDEGGLSGYPTVEKNQSLSFIGQWFCSKWRRSILEMWYATECNCNTTRNCSPLAGNAMFLPRFVTLNPIQCSGNNRKIRYTIMFQNASDQDLYRGVAPISTWIGEASWDDSSNQLFIAACRIQDPVNHFGDAAGDCTMRLSLRYSSIWNIRNVASIVGQVWTNKTSNASEYFRKIKLASTYTPPLSIDRGLRYEYTEMDRVRKLCPATNVVKKGKYPDAHSFDMSFDMSVENSKRQQFASGGAIPISFGSEVCKKIFPHTSYMAMSKPKTDLKAPSNISYKINIYPFSGIMVGMWFPTMNWSTNSYGQMEIIAEGVYDPQTGQLCMVGCRKLFQYASKSTNDSRDCEIHLNFQFPSLNDKMGGFINGTIGSTRTKTDPLYFDDLTLSSTVYTLPEAKKTIGRMDFEITMVLISNTLSCIFIGLQLFHLKRNPEVFSGISLTMLLILSLGHLIPIVQNFEAIFWENSSQQRLWVSTWGWLEANEAAILVITTVAFLLQLCLLQLVWTSQASEENDDRGSWFAQKRTFFVLLPTYNVGALFTLICKQIRRRNHQPIHNAFYNAYPKYALWEGLLPFIGLMLDGFLLPQVLFNLNAFRGSAEKTLCGPFYIGITAVRLVPHAYDLYRTHSYPRWHVEGSYYYADPAAGFYSMGWDIVILCGSIALATMVFVQQRVGGHCIIPRRFRELELYEKVPLPAVDSKGGIE